MRIDEALTKKHDSNDKYFCCNDCLAKYEDATMYFPDDNEYNKLFCVESDQYLIIIIVNY